MGLKHAEAELRTAADGPAGDHEDPVAGVVQRLRMLGRRGDVRPHHLEDEEVVFADQRVVMQAAFEVGMTLADQRRLNIAPLAGGQAERLELVDLCPGAVSNGDDRVGQRRWSAG